MPLGLGSAVSGNREINPLLLDYYPGAVGAYSTRKLRFGYTGYAMQVREGSGMNYEADVGFDAAGIISLDSPIANETGGSGPTLGDFVDAGGADSDAFVKVWYDQSSSGNNASKTDTAGKQPKIVNGGAVVALGGKPALDFDGSDDELVITDTDDFSFTDGSGTDTAASFFVAYNLEETTSGKTLISKDESGSAREWTWFFDGEDQRFYLKSGGGGNQQSYDGNDVGTGHQLATMLYSGSESYTGIAFYKNGAAATMVQGQDQTYSGMSNTSAPIRIANRYDDSSLNTVISEIIVYASSQSANRTAIEADINAHFSIY